MGAAAVLLDVVVEHRVFSTEDRNDESLTWPDIRFVPSSTMRQRTGIPRLGTGVVPPLLHMMKYSSLLRVPVHRNTHCK